MFKDRFQNRHIGPDDADLEKMLKVIGADSLEELMDQTVPSEIRLHKPLELAPEISEYDYLQELAGLAARNKVFKSYIGLGYNNTETPPVIQRNMLENPGWYTAYTPYQAEIAQGRLEALLNFQTVASDLTGMPVANASLLDEATAAAEAMSMMHSLRSRDAVTRGANSFFVSEECHPQTIDVLKTRAYPQGIELIIGNHEDFHFSDKIFGALLQYPSTEGYIYNYREFVDKAHSIGALVCVAADIMSLLLLTPPGEWGADVVVGNSQRFGVPMGYGGPHAAFFATREEYKRHIPGRIIGVSKDRHGNPAMRMALQTREQHIRRDKATSNICTAQALLACMASAYAVYHGPAGLQKIARRIHRQTALLARHLEALGCEILNQTYFDTLLISMPENYTQVGVKKEALKEKINFRYYTNNRIGISLDETVNESDIETIIKIFSRAMESDIEMEEIGGLENEVERLPHDLQRTSPYLQHPIFNKFHSETEMMRYLKKLENKDLSLVHSMIPLGSCTMKLNAASELLPITWPEFAQIHPFVPLDQTHGYQEMFEQLKKGLREITGLDGVSFQPNSGAQGEYAGLTVIKNYHQSRGEGHRDIALIPSSAHGTNPASAVMAGLKVVVVACDKGGNIEVEDLRKKAEENRENLAALMVTYPSTHGVYEKAILEITQIVHDNGGQVYMDGANMNAQVGLTSPGRIGADVCHLNLHKTFAIPHGGGGPGEGPICVKEHLVSFLPGHAIVRTGGKNKMSAISSAPFGSALILLISYGYIRMLGSEGLTASSKVAIANANYLKNRLAPYYPVLYSGNAGRVAHEMILDCRQFKESAGIEVQDIAKRLMDYGFHAPTVSFPVHGTLMIEPTESESLEELDRFCEAMISIRQEIEEIEQGKCDARDNVLKNAPHTALEACDDNWSHAYSRTEAVYPLSYLHEGKFWPSVARIEDAYGDRNLICTCPPMEAYTEETKFSKLTHSA